MQLIESSMAIIVLLTLNFIFLSSLQILTEFINEKLDIFNIEKDKDETDSIERKKLKLKNLLK